MINLGDSNFDETISQSTIPVLVDFWAEWCGPCKALAPVLEEVDRLYQNKIIVAKVNVDNSRDVASRYNIRSIPTIILIKNGERVGEKIGMQSKAQLINFIDNNI